jgi:transposase-like protein
VALTESDLSELLAAFRAGEMTDTIRSSLEWVLQQLIEAEATAVIGAGSHERTESRMAQGNGHRPKLISTGAGDVELAIPKLRQGSFFPSLLERHRRIDRALYAVVMEAYVHGISTRKVDDLVKALGAASGISKSEVSRICAELDRVLEVFRPLDHTGFPYVFVDATYLKGRVWGRVVSRAVVIATGDREVLGIDVGDSEDGAFWTAFLGDDELHAAEPAGAQASAITTSASSRRSAPCSSAPPGNDAGCTHAQRLGPSPQSLRRDGRRRHPHDLRPTRTRPRPPSSTSRPHARGPVPRRRHHAPRRRRRPPRLLRVPRGALAQDWSTHPLERINGEIERRTNVVGIFPNDPAIIRLVTAVLVETHDEWAVTEPRYLSEESMTKIGQHHVTIEEAPLAITA